MSVIDAEWLPVPPDMPKGVPIVGPIEPGDRLLIPPCVSTRTGKSWHAIILRITGVDAERPYYRTVSAVEEATGEEWLAVLESILREFAIRIQKETDESPNEEPSSE